MGFSRQEYWSELPCPPSGDLPDPGTELASSATPALSGGFFTAEPPGKPKNTGVGGLSLLQGIFPTQELNQGLLHCRQILYELRCQESPSLIPVLGRFPEGGHGNSLQYSYLENPMSLTGYRPWGHKESDLTGVA